jgi:hypothetical protein
VAITMALMADVMMIFRFSILVSQFPLLVMVGKSRRLIAQINGVGGCHGLLPSNVGVPHAGDLRLSDRNLSAAAMLTLATVLR